MPEKFPILHPLRQSFRSQYDLTPPEWIQQRFSAEEKSLTSHKEVLQFWDFLAALRKTFHIVSRDFTNDSLIAYLLSATQVNPLPPHYRCPHCLYAELSDESDDGFDLPDRTCKRCNTPLLRSGHDIPMVNFPHGEPDFVLLARKEDFPEVLAQTLAYWQKRDVRVLLQTEKHYDDTVLLRLCWRGGEAICLSLELMPSAEATSEILPGNYAQSFRKRGLMYAESASIAYREDVFHYVQNALPDDLKRANLPYTIMERVRKGKYRYAKNHEELLSELNGLGLSPEFIDAARHIGHLPRKGDCIAMELACQGILQSEI